MSELTISASEMREKFAEVLERLDRGRVRITKHGQDRAYLISVRELRALEETIAVLENEQLMQSLFRGLEDSRAGRVRDAGDGFAELDAEMRAEE